MTFNSLVDYLLSAPSPDHRFRQQPIAKHAHQTDQDALVRDTFVRGQQDALPCNRRPHRQNRTHPPSARLSTFPASICAVMM